jgi:hypothetical protein
MWHRVGVRLDLNEQAQPVQLRDDQLARLAAVAAFQRTDEDRVRDIRHARQHIRDLVQRDMGAQVQHAGHRQAVTLAKGEIVEVVRWRDLHRTGALGGIGILIGDDGYAPPDKRQDGLATNQVAIPFIVGMHGDRGVAQHRLRPRRRNRDAQFGRACDRVADVPKAALHLLAFHLQVRNRGLEFGIPVHQPAVAIDQALAMQPDEDLAHRLRQPVIHGEALARPVERGAEPAQLRRDGAAGLRLPLPHAVEEAGAAKRLARRALAVQQAFHNHLRRDAGVVGAGLPQRIAALHPPPTDQRVLHGKGQRMAHVQAAGDVGRRDHDGEGLSVRPRIGGERASLLPPLVEAGLGFGGGEGFAQHGVPRRAALRPHG